jgi:hypothetical protein
MFLLHKYQVSFYFHDESVDTIFWLLYLEGTTFALSSSERMTCEMGRMRSNHKGLRRTHAQYPP